MLKDTNSYRQIFKATSIFGGVQVANIIIQIMRSKLIAILLGPSGMGIIGLYTSTLNFIGSLTSFGLGVSAVKDITLSKNSNDSLKLINTLSVLSRLIWITGTIGVIITALFSKELSIITFNDTKHSFLYIWLSITLLFNQICSGQLAILQGLSHLKRLAKANVLGNLIGLIISIPIYEKYRIDGIVPSLIISSFFTMACSIYYRNKTVKVNKQFTINHTIKEGFSMIKLGFFISLSGLLTFLVAFLIRICIGRIGNIEEVGLYTAGFAIINNYTGLVFNAMSADYYPRLVSASSNDANCSKIVNQQLEIAILIISPLVIIMSVFIKEILTLFYTKDFLLISAMIYWASLGLIFKAASWSIAFIFLAKGDSKIYFFNEVSANIYILILSVLGFYFDRLTGLGISFLASYSVYLIQVYKICSKKFGLKITKESARIFCFHLLLCSLAVISMLEIHHTYKYIVGLILISISLYFSFHKIFKKVGISRFKTTN